MSRVYNFAAGPAVLPEPVLEKAARQMLEHEGHGMSVMEMSHRSKMFEDIIGDAESRLRSLMNVPENYKVLFLQGGASLQFSMVPLNLSSAEGAADYVCTGSWAKAAIKEGSRFTKVNVVGSSEDRNYSYVPVLDSSLFNKNADYFHITSNETIFGIRYTKFPDTGSVPLVADMSSNILSEVFDVSKFGLIYAGAQKNIGPAGLVVVIIREDLIGKAGASVPVMLNYKIHADNGSMYNTPPTFSIYIAQLVFEWLQGIGGVKEMQKINEHKAGLLYGFLDESKLFKGTANKKDRSLMNITFVLPNDELNDRFVKEAAAKGFVNLKGHRSVGGMRASIYNAMPVEGVKALVGFMKEFEAQNA
ncbi:MAG: 3-phosphoserine/phosphohydroxythreonine transaminase [Bacillota bacterium]|nr:3-phosphoserine/phosphohydroxythreonine transaminase [Bacillota bacterium]